jgi:beta-lactamase regulating signal transducer with metallopeptidase domain
MDIIYDFSVWAGKASLQSSLLALALWFICTARKTSALFGIQYVLGILIIARLCLPLTPSIEAHPLNWIKTRAPQMENAKPAPNSFIHGTLLNGGSISKAAPSEVTAPIQSPLTAATSSFEWKRLLTLLWAIGFGLGLARFLIAQIRHRSLLKSCEPLEHQTIEETVAEIRTLLRIRQPIRLLTSDQIGSAAVTGTFSPKLIVSSSFIRHLSHQQRRHVLMHELVHIKRFDPLVNRITLILQAIHWFNPLVRWALKKFQQDRELICDAMAIKTLGESQRSAYGETLIEILTSFRNQRSFPNLVPIISNKHEIKRRIMMISMNQSTPSKRPILLIAGLAAVLAVTFTRPASVEAQGATGGRNTIHVGKASSATFHVGDKHSGTSVQFASSSSTGIKLKDVSSRGKGSGVLVAPGSGKQMYNVHEIDVSSFDSGGILLVDITMGDGDSAGSFDLFPEGVPLPSGSPDGSVARSYDITSGESRTMVYQFAKGQVFRFGASGNWFSEKGTTNEFRFEARAVPVKGAQVAAVAGVSVGIQQIGVKVEKGVPVVHSITTTTSGAVNELTLHQDGATVVRLAPKNIKGNLTISKGGKVVKSKTVSSLNALDIVLPDGVTISPNATGHFQGQDGTVTTYILNPEGHQASSNAILNFEFDAKKKDSKESKVSN